MTNRRFRLTYAVAMLVALAGPVGAQRSQRPLALVDISSTLAQLVGGSPLDYIARAKITYGVTGVSMFDQFFRSTAVTYGGFYFGRHLLDDATVELKKFARSKMAVAELRNEIKELTRNADTSQWSVDQSIAVLKAAKKKNQLTRDEEFYFAAMSGLVAATVPVVRASVEQAPALARNAPTLVKQAPSSFDPLDAPKVVLSVNRSAQQIQAIPREGTTLLEAYVVLSKGLKAINGET